MVETRDHFVRRLTVLGRKHEQMTHGYTTRVGPDGLIVVRPKRRARNASGLKLVILAVAMFFVMKITMVVSAGPASYESKLAPLQAGTVIEQMGAYVMSIDPLTKLASEQVSLLMLSLSN